MTDGQEARRLDPTARARLGLAGAAGLTGVEDLTGVENLAAGRGPGQDLRLPAAGQGAPSGRGDEHTASVAGRRSVGWSDGGSGRSPERCRAGGYRCRDRTVTISQPTDALRHRWSMCLRPVVPVGRV